MCAIGLLLLVFFGCQQNYVSSHYHSIEDYTQLGFTKEALTCTHTVQIQTGDRLEAGLSLGDDASLASIILESQGVRSKDHGLRITADRDIVDIEFVTAPWNVRKVDTIHLRRANLSSEEQWYVESVTVEYRRGAARSIFPIHRWIVAGETLIITEYDSLLPQDDVNMSQRRRRLELKRENYQFNKQSNFPGIAVALPPDEIFSDTYKVALLSPADTMAIIGSIDMTINLKKLTDYDRFYSEYMPIPKGATYWMFDRDFGNQRLAGANPAVIRLCTKIPSHMPVTNEMVVDQLEGYTLEEQIAAMKIYIIDFRYLADIECNPGQKIIGPTALFYSDSRGILMPIAIMLNPIYSAETNPIFLPDDEGRHVWLAAKIWFNNADASHHQAHAHLGMTHFLLEGCALATNRQISQSHPLYRLLAPHFLHVLAINDLGLKRLIVPGGSIDQSMVIGNIGLKNIIRNNWSKWNILRDGDLRADLVNRGVADSDILPNYHFRDDALLLWDTLKDYVSTVLYNAYQAKNGQTSQQRMEEDFELQAWAAELADEGSGAGIGGMPSNFESVDQLITVVTVFIYTASVQHAAVNFMQYDEYGFPPNYPGWINGEPPKNKNDLKESDLMAMLPGVSRTTVALLTTRLLSERATQALGDFEVQYAYDPTSVRALERLREELEGVSKEISARNNHRLMEYDYLDPRNIPNSIAI